MISRVKLPRFRFLLARNGNSLGILTNRRWKRFHKRCQANFRQRNAINNENLALRATRLANIKVVECSNLSELVDRDFSRLKSERLSTTLPASMAKAHSCAVHEILISLAPTVEEFYASNFQPYWIQFQRTVPGEVSAASAFGWHIDDNPKEIMKIFVYLNDVSESNGAFRAVAHNGSTNLLRSGFRSWSETQRLRSQQMVENYISEHPDELEIIEGPSGTCLIFDNNLVHKGTPPVNGFRHVIQIEVYPSMYPLRFEDVEKAITSSFNRDFPVDPYKNDFGL